MNSGNWWRRRQDKRRAMKRKAELTRELTSGDVDPVRFAEIEAELREILRAYPPESYYNPLGI